jgi:hypothetical protein
LKSLERELRAAGPDGRSSLIGKLEDLDRRANDLSMPGMLTENTYTLRANIRALLGRIQTRQ